MVEKNRSSETNGVLLAKVDERLNVREDGQLDVWLKVEAENRTGETLLLDENYHISMAEAFGVEAFDLNSKQRLTAFHGNGGIEVVFKPGTCLPAGQKFVWLLKYKTTRFGVIKEKEQELVTAIFTLAPKLSYKEIPIQNHRFQLSVIFERPRDGELFRELSVSQSNNHNVPAEIKKKVDRVVCVFEPFDLGKGSTLRATFVYKSRSSDLTIANTRASSGLGTPVGIREVENPGGDSQSGGTTIQNIFNAPVQGGFVQGGQGHRQHNVYANNPKIDETIGAVVKLIQESKLGHLDKEDILKDVERLKELSSKQQSPDTLERIHKRIGMVNSGIEAADKGGELLVKVSPYLATVWQLLTSIGL